MIVREFIDNNEMPFDFFNDGTDTYHWLKGFDPRDPRYGDAWASADRLAKRIEEWRQWVIKERIRPNA